MTNEPITTRRYATDKPQKPPVAVKPTPEYRQQANPSTRRKPDWLVIVVGLLFLSSMVIAWLVFVEG